MLCSLASNSIIRDYPEQLQVQFLRINQATLSRCASPGGEKEQTIIAWEHINMYVAQSSSNKRQRLGPRIANIDPGSTIEGVCFPLDQPIVGLRKAVGSVSGSPQPCQQPKHFSGTTQLSGMTQTVASEPTWNSNQCRTESIIHMSRGTLLPNGCPTHSRYWRWLPTTTG